MQRRSLVLLWLIFTRMNPTARREDAALFAVALVYFCLIHLAPQSPGIERWLPKESDRRRGLRRGGRGARMVAATGTEVFR